MMRFRLFTTTAVLTILASGASLAHEGHAVPAGVPAADHLHLAQGVMVSGPLLLGLLAGGIAVGVLIMRRRAPRRTAKGSHGRDTSRR